MKIAVGCDHAAVELKNIVISHLEEKGFEVVNCGCNGEGSVDYPDIAKVVCQNVVSNNCEKGILICGTGIGMSISANKIKGIRAAVCHDYFSTKYTRLHNNANVMCMGARVIGQGTALELVDVFFSTEFEGGRHQRRIDKITDLENL